MQNLYAREQHPLPGWVTLRAERNHRSPREVIALIDRILERNGTAGDAVAGAGVEVPVYDDPAALMERTKTALTRALGAGFRKESMLVVTFRGREQSAFTPLSRLGPHALRAFTGRYDLLGGPVYTEGNLLIDSVYRLKGQSAPCVVFTEIDFETLDERARRKLFVGMTRASMKLILVISSRAHSALGAHLASQQAGDG